MSPFLLRQLWEMIEEIPQQSLESLDDSGLVMWVLSHLEERLQLKNDERQTVEAYLNNHLMLIRDIAESKQHRYCPLAT